MDLTSLSTSIGRFLHLEYRGEKLVDKDTGEPAGLYIVGTDSEQHKAEMARQLVVAMGYVKKAKAGDDADLSGMPTELRREHQIRENACVIVGAKNIEWNGQPFTGQVLEENVAFIKAFGWAETQIAKALMSSDFYAATGDPIATSTSAN